MKTPIMYENTATPNKRIAATTTLSKSLLGFKSPNPTVERDVNDQYYKIRVIYPLDIWSNPKKVMKYSLLRFAVT
jgi:hypothetical protein